jgi:predicted amidophosphoribosyltransferase
MSIKGVILDLSGTTFKSDGTVQDGIEEFLSFCNNNNLRVAFLTNNEIYKRFLIDRGLRHDVCVTPNLVNKNKPSPIFIKYITDYLGIPKEKFIYVGDNDFTDAICASHSKILYFSAKWKNHNPQYGIPVGNLGSLSRIIKRHFLKNDYWGWKLQTRDSRERKVSVFALLDCRSSLKDYAVKALKYGEHRHRFFFLLHLISSLYLSGLYKDVDYWATYPSHSEGTSKNPFMSWLFDRVTKEFRTKYIDLFIRHRESIDSGTSRRDRRKVDFGNQLSTVILNSEFRSKIRGKRILVIDDFITEGYSLECARNLLFQAQVKNIIGMAIGKYGQKYHSFAIRDNFDPFHTVDLSQIEYEERILEGQKNLSVMTILENSLDM